MLVLLGLSNHDHHCLVTHSSHLYDVTALNYTLTLCCSATAWANVTGKKHKAVARLVASFYSCQSQRMLVEKVGPRLSLGVVSDSFRPLKTIEVSGSQYRGIWALEYKTPWLRIYRYSSRKLRLPYPRQGFAKCCYGRCCYSNSLCSLAHHTF